MVVEHRQQRTVKKNNDGGKVNVNQGKSLNGSRFNVIGNLREEGGENEANILKDLREGIMGNINSWLTNDLVESIVPEKKKRLKETIKEENWAILIQTVITGIVDRLEQFSQEARTLDENLGKGDETQMEFQSDKFKLIDLVRGDAGEVTHMDGASQDY
ncbi:hypothetical protein Gotur_023579 [Gossypium turneri]